METVSFTQMADGTRDDYLLIQSLEARYAAGTARRVLNELARQGQETIEGYKITRLEHALQSATRAWRDDADTDWVVAALLHDIGDGLAPQNHDKVAGAILRPYLREECTWVVENHGVFQMLYYAHHYGWDQNEREKFRGSPFFASAAAFCARWDQTSFDPDYASETLEFFASKVEEVFARTAYAPEILLEGTVRGLPPALEAS